MIKKTHLLGTILMFFFSTVMYSQTLLQKAILQEESGNYAEAIKNYKAYLADHSDDFKSIIALADVLARTGDLSEAEYYYAQVPENTPEYTAMTLQYGLLLKKLMRYEEASVMFSHYMTRFPERGVDYLMGLTFASNALQKSPEYEAVVLPSNSSASDFALTFYQNRPVFSSFREDILMNAMEKEMNNSAMAHNSFIYNKQNNGLQYIKAYNNKINHIGPLSFSASGTRCAVIEAKIPQEFVMDRSFKNASVQIAEINEKGEFTSFKPFEYNEIGSAINSVFLTNDGNTLYFSSNRKGGFGGFDIYVSHFSNNHWTTPENLGPDINTVDNEVSPFLYQDKLYYASDGPFGLGGYDIFYAINNAGKWSDPVNMGNGINSTEDDYFPAVNENGELFFTSNRLGGKGKNDIYKSVKISTPEVLAEVVPEAVSLDKLTEETQKHTTDSPTAQAVALIDNVVVETAFKLPEFDADKVGKELPFDALFDGVHRVGLDEQLPDNEVFFIQLASISNGKPDFNRYKHLLRYGNIYKMIINRSVKVRLGYYSERKEAEEILAKVRSSGYKDAFISYEMLNTAKMELVLTSNDDKSFKDEGNFNTRNPAVAEQYYANNRYKVRLASYEDPIWFDVNKVKDLGRVEQWTKGDWIIFILAGFNNLEEAKNAQIQAINRGFKTAEVVVDNGGILERLKKN